MSELMQPVLGWLGKMLLIIVPLLIVVAYLSYVERKIIGFMQGRLGPNRVGIWGLLQPVADIIKLLGKEIIYPAQSNRYLFMLAPLLSLAPALLAWAVIPFGPHFVLADLNVGVLFVFTMSALGVYGMLIAGWASNSKYAFLGATRACAQTISYEIAMGFALIGVLMAAGSMRLIDIVVAQQGGVGHWFIWPLFPLFMVFWIAGIAETNRAPFDLAEGESELVAGFHVEYSGIAFSLFFTAEYANMVLISMLLSLFFLGGWYSPVAGIGWLEPWLAWIPGVVWLWGKASMFLFIYLWIRATFPRYRYDQLMRLGWKVLIPLTLVWLVVLAILIQCQLPPWFKDNP